MSKFLLSFPLLFLLLAACNPTEELPTSFYDCHFDFADSSLSHPQHLHYQALLKEMTAKGVVGITMSVHQPRQGLWLGASGKADLHHDVDLKPCNITRFGSIVKIFTATLILTLQEEGKLSLDDKLSQHLQGEHLTKIKNAQDATLRQLLQHSSGMYNYIQNLKFQTASLNDLIKAWEADELLEYAHHQAPYFSLGEDLRYSNTAYIFLGLVIEKIEGKPLYQVFDEKIIRPLGLKSTQFAGKNPVPPGIIRGYIDIYSNFNVMESTYYSGWDYYTADGGLLSTPYDMNLFFNALIHGKILRQTSLNEMFTWKMPKESPTDFFPISYGLGIFKIETPKGIAYLHSGDAIGYYANLLYFPGDSTTIIYAVNSNYGKIDALISTKEAMENIINHIK